jgi:hypothetical protein
MEGGAKHMDKSKKAVALILFILLLFVIVLYMSGLLGGGRNMSAHELRCVPGQKIMPFGDKLIYYDGQTIYCLSSSNQEMWSYDMGGGASFDTDGQRVVAWAGTSLHILDRNGRSSYSDSFANTIQFARISQKYVAFVTGTAENPQLIFKDLNGNQADQETQAFANSVILDIGFFDNGAHAWIISMDVGATVVTYRMHLIQVGLSNTGTVSLGEQITYKVLYADNLLNVINTHEILQYTYRGERRNSANRQIVYGWQLIDFNLSGDKLRTLFVPAFQTAGVQEMTELRVLEGNKNFRYTLPDTCVGAGIIGNRLFAISKDSLYRADLSAQRFQGLNLPSNIRDRVTGYLGQLDGGVALVVCGQRIFALTLP